MLVTVKAKTEEVQAKDHYRRPGGGLGERYALMEMTTGSVRSWGGWVMVITDKQQCTYAIAVHRGG